MWPARLRALSRAPRKHALTHTDLRSRNSAQSSAAIIRGLARAEPGQSLDGARCGGELRRLVREEAPMPGFFAPHGKKAQRKCDATAFTFDDQTRLPGQRRRTGRDGLIFHFLQLD